MKLGDYQRMAEKNRMLYPVGTIVELISMDDCNAVPEGTRGVVALVDDVGTVHVDWDNGQKLGVCTEVDVIRKVAI